MERNYLKLQRIFAMTGLNAEMFYSISFGKYNLRLQGKYSSELITAMSKFKDMKVEINDDIMTFTKHDVNIVIAQ